MNFKRRNNLIIFLVFYIAYVSIYIARLNLSMASPGLMEAGLSDDRYGFIGTIFLVVYAVGRLVNGIISDKVQPWIMICTGLCLVGISNITISFFRPFIAFCILWGINAFGQSMLWSSILRLISEVYEPSVAKLKISYMVTTVALGNVIGILLGTFTIEKFGLNAAFYVPALISLTLAVIIFIFITPIRCIEIPEKKHIPMHQILLKKEIQQLLMPIMFHGIMKDNISHWMTLYYAATYHIDLKNIAVFVLFIPVCGFVGRLLYPFLYKITGENEHKVSILGYFLCVAFSVLLFAVKEPITAAVSLGMLYLAVSIINTSYLSIYPMRYASSGNVASVSGLIDFATYLGAGIGSAVYGMTVERFGYSFMFGTWTIISVISIVILLLSFEDLKQLKLKHN